MARHELGLAVEFLPPPQQVIFLPDYYALAQKYLPNGSHGVLRAGAAGSRRHLRI